MKTLFELLEFTLGIVLGVIIGLVYMLVVTPIWIIARILVGIEFEDVLDEWIDKTQYMFNFEQT